MAAGAKEKMKVKLTIDPFQELDKGGKTWIEDSKELKKTIKDFDYTDTVELDPRKWSEKKLEDALQALVRYELKLFAVRFNKIQGKVGKSASDKEKDKANDELLDAYKELVKDANDKISLALDEVVKDKGDNKKGLRDGKSALKELEKLDLKKMISATRVQLVAALNGLAAELKKAGAQEKAKQAAGARAGSLIDQARAVYDQQSNAATEAMVDLLESAEATLTNKEANSALKAYASLVKTEFDAFSDFKGAANDFEAAIEAAAVDVTSGKLDEVKARQRAAKLAKLTGPDGYATTAQKAVATLAKAFANVEKELK